MSGTIVIAGGGLAGVRTAERLRRDGHREGITLLCAEQWLPYDRPPLSKQVLGGPSPPEPVPLRPADRFRELDLDLRLRTSALGLDPARRVVHLSDGSDLSYAALVVATGQRARTLPALERFDNVYTLRTFDDCARLHGALRRASRLAVVGGGVLGCEVAATARGLGLDVTMVEPLRHPLARVLGEAVGDAVGAWHREQGVTVRCGVTVDGAAGADRLDGLRLGDGTTVPADIVLVAVGAVPNVEWLRGSGIELDDGVVCDATGRTSLENVYAAGDVARFPHPGAGSTARVEHWTAASDTAAVVARNLTGNDDHPAHLTEPPYFWSDQYGAKIQCLGLPRPDDEPTVVAGALDERRFLALYSRAGRVTGAIAIGLPPALMRCRRVVSGNAPLADVLAARPWQRPPEAATSRQQVVGKPGSGPHSGAAG